MRILQRLAAASALLLIAACATSSVQRIGTTSYAPLPPTADVAVFTAEGQVGHPFEVVAAIAYMDPGKFEMLSVGDTYEPLRQKAREVGANGIIIDNSSPVISGFVSRGISVDARAIHIAAFSSGMAPQAPQAAPAPPEQAKDAPQGPTKEASQGQTKDASQVLRELQKLHKEGVINDREYEAKKAEVLRRM